MRTLTLPLAAIGLTLGLAACGDAEKADTTAMDPMTTDPTGAGNMDGTMGTTGMASDTMGTSGASGTTTMPTDPMTTDSTMPPPANPTTPPPGG